jgi:hypothetical protein
MPEMIKERKCVRAAIVAMAMTGIVVWAPGG